MRIIQFEDGAAAELAPMAQSLAVLCSYLASAYAATNAEVGGISDEELDALSQKQREEKIALAGAAGALEEIMEKFGERGYALVLPRSIVEQLRPFAESIDITPQKPLLVGPNGNA